jgi:hypothetical protein
MCARKGKIIINTEDEDGAKASLHKQTLLNKPLLRHTLIRGNIQ